MGASDSSEYGIGVHSDPEPITVKADELLQRNRSCIEDRDQFCRFCLNMLLTGRLGLSLCAGLGRDPDLRGDTFRDQSNHHCGVLNN